MPDSSFFLPLLLQSAALPFLASAAVSAAPALLRQARRTAPHGAPDAIASPVPVLAVMLGFLASYFAILHAQWSPLPRQALDWMPWLVLGAGPLAFLAERLERRPARFAARIALSAGAAAITAWPALPGAGPLATATVIIAAAALMAAAWSLLARPAPGPAAGALPLAITAGAAALALALDSSQLLGQLCGALAAVLAAFILAGALRSGAGLSGSAKGIAVLLLGSLLANAYLYAGFPLLFIGLSAAGLLGAAIAQALGRRGVLGVRTAWITAAILCAVPGLIIVAAAVRAAQDSGGY